MNTNSHVALLIIDMMNHLEFEHGDTMYEATSRIAHNIVKLKKGLKEKGTPVIYVNDNYGKWQSDFPSIIDHFLHSSVRGSEIVKMLKPEDDDYFILKPKFSGFYATPLELLLDHLNINDLIITGIAGNMCVLFTANDAYMRGYELFIPSDCIASVSDKANTDTLHYLKEVLKANTSPSPTLFK